MDFRESLTLRLPDIRGGESSISDLNSGFLTERHVGRKTNEGLIVEIAAIHEGMTSNYNYYSKEALTEAIDSWTNPYSRPVIINHDTLEKPLGRVMNAEMRQEEDGSAFVHLQVAVTDPDAVRMVMDGRYLTGSVGGKTGEALCSICKKDWTKASAYEMPCRHERGKTYKGKLAFLEMRQINFKEYSFVNVPADERSGIRHIGGEGEGVLIASQEEESSAYDARLFSINLNEQEIVDLTFGEGSNILSDLRKKEARPMYMQTKGAFLTALAQDIPADSKENELDEETMLEQEEDILAITESLSDDLAAESVEEDEVAEEDQEEETAVVAEGDEEEQADDAAPSDEEEAPAEEPVAADDTEEEAPEVDAEEPAAEEAAAEVEEEISVAEEDLESSDVAEEEEDELDVAEEEDDRDERIAALESQVAELKAKESELLETNDKLKSALKRGLAERVVDNKIALGIEESAERAALVEEHVSRSASSLADSLRDLSSMKAVAVEVPTQESVPQVEKTSGATLDEGATSVSESDTTPNEEIDPEKTLVDVFMGRRSL